MVKNCNIICILCPNCCDMRVSFEGKEILELEDARCPRGLEYAREELFNPTRTLTSTVPIKSHYWKTVSVRTNKPIPKDRIFDVYEQLSSMRLAAPVKRGDVLIENVLGLGASIIATRSVLE
ncbi:DUF1667 domain-containing protein [bacterium]|nr:DUF1667 domain-containing protein [bacterium]